VVREVDVIINEFFELVGSGGREVFDERFLLKDIVPILLHLFLEAFLVRALEAFSIERLKVLFDLDGVSPFLGLLLTVLDRMQFLDVRILRYIDLTLVKRDLGK